MCVRRYAATRFSVLPVAYNGTTLLSETNETKQKQNKIIQREKTPGDVRTTPLVLWPLPFVRYPGVGCRANETTSRQRLLPVSNKQTNKDGFL
jgi:hypothetical protein